MSGQTVKFAILYWGGRLGEDDVPGADTAGGEAFSAAKRRKPRTIGSAWRK